MVTDPATGTEVLVAARKLVNRRGIRALRGQRSADYVHLLLHRHEVLWAEGAAAESMLVAPATMHHLPFDLCERLAGMQPARPILRADPAVQPRCALKCATVRSQASLAAAPSWRGVESL